MESFSAAAIKKLIKSSFIFKLHQEVDTFSIKKAYCYEDRGAVVPGVYLTDASDYREQKQNEGLSDWLHVIETL